jgi:hypothetical protein
VNVEKVKEPAITYFFFSAVVILAVVVLFVALFFVDVVLVLVDGSSIPYNNCYLTIIHM